MEVTQNNLKDRVDMILELLSIQDQKFKEVVKVNSEMAEADVDVESLLNLLTEYLSVFELEESIMLELAYSNIDIHQEHHQYFNQKLRQFQQDYKTHNATMVPRIIIFMKKWLVSHIMIEHDAFIKELNAVGNDGNRNNS